MPETRLHTCMLCEAVCGIAVELEGGRVVGVRGDREDPFSKGHVCPKAAAIPDVVLITPRVHSDERGFFMETYRKRTFADFGITASFVQDNHSQSRRGALRGLHYQIRQPQGKLIRALAGEIYDVAVDLRPGSDTYGTWVIEGISSDAGNMLWIPPGFAHGFIVDSEEAEVSYLITGPRVPSSERVIRWNDPKLNITWPLGRIAPILSDRDANAPLLDELPTIQRSTW